MSSASLKGAFSVEVGLGSDIKQEKRAGPIELPWIIPQLKGLDCEISPRIFTAWVRLLKKLEIHLITKGFILSLINFSRRMDLSHTSKALVKSTETHLTYLKVSRANVTKCIMQRRAAVVLPLGRNANWSANVEVANRG